MPQEIIYTSAQRGLHSGSRGFCTVVSSPGMTSTMSEKLESLSGYRHLFPPHHESAALNPTAHSHLRMKIAGEPCHVLSRICDAGADYSGRSNKLAHHLVLQKEELCDAGPAWLSNQDGVFQSQWDGKAKLLSECRRLSGGNRKTGPLVAWNSLAGDSGWAGSLISHWYADSSSPAYIVFEPGTVVLGLVEEAISLMPESDRWRATYCTYYVSSCVPSDADCRWRFVPAGSIEARKARTIPGSLIISLADQSPLKKSNIFVSAARAGRILRRSEIPHGARATESHAAVLIDPIVGLEPSTTGKGVPVSGERPPELDLSDNMANSSVGFETRGRVVPLISAVAAICVVTAASVFVLINPDQPSSAVVPHEEILVPKPIPAPSTTQAQSSPSTTEGGKGNAPNKELEPSPNEQLTAEEPVLAPEKEDRKVPIPPSGLILVDSPQDFEGIVFAASPLQNLDDKLELLQVPVKQPGGIKVVLFPSHRLKPANIETGLSFNATIPRTLKDEAKQVAILTLVHKDSKLVAEWSGESYAEKYQHELRDSVLCVGDKWIALRPSTVISSVFVKAKRSYLRSGSVNVRQDSITKPLFLGDVVLKFGDKVIPSSKVKQNIVQFTIDSPVNKEDYDALNNAVDFVISVWSRFKYPRNNRTGPDFKFFNELQKVQKSLRRMKVNKDGINFSVSYDPKQSELGWEISPTLTEIGVMIGAIDKLHQHEAINYLDWLFTVLERRGLSRAWSEVDNFYKIAYDDGGLEIIKSQLQELKAFYNVLGGSLFVEGQLYFDIPVKKTSVIRVTAATVKLGAESK